MPSKLPPRPDASLDPDLVKPSIWGGVFLWIAFIVPMVFVYFAYNSVPVVVLLFIIRVFIMFIPYIREVFGMVPKKPVPVAVVAARSSVRTRRGPMKVVRPEPVVAMVSSSPGVISILFEEIKAEVSWVLRKLHLRNVQEEERLALYRKFRGWD
jgi:hypothetical protein